MLVYFLLKNNKNLAKIKLYYINIYMYHTSIMKYIRYNNNKLHLYIDNKSKRNNYLSIDISLV